MLIELLPSKLHTLHDEFSMFRDILISEDVGFARLICGLTEMFGSFYLVLVLGCYSCIFVLGTGNNNGHYCVETCRPYITQLMTVRREGECCLPGWHYLEIKPVSLRNCFSLVFSIFAILGWKFWICEKCMMIQGRNY